VWARTAPLGEPSAPVVVAAFGVFEPRLITRAYEQGRGTASRADVLAARERGAVESLEELLPDAAPAALDGAGDLLRRATGVAAADLAGRPLFAGLLSLPWPGTPLGRVWHGASLLREYRGDVHVAAGVAAGLTGLEMNLLTEYWLGWAPTTYAATRGWSPAAMAAADAGLVERGLVAGGALTDEGRAVRDGVEERTDAAMAPLLEALGTGLPELTRQLAEWSAAVVTGGGGPADPRKRASG
jgi:hypothetical protein